MEDYGNETPIFCCVTETILQENQCKNFNNLPYDVLKVHTKSTEQKYFNSESKTLQSYHLDSMEGQEP